VSAVSRASKRINNISNPQMNQGPASKEQYSRNSSKNSNNH